MYKKIYIRDKCFGGGGTFPDALISRATINLEFLVPLSPVRAIELAPLASSSISASRRASAVYHLHARPLRAHLPFLPSSRRFSSPSWERVNEIGGGTF